MPCKQALLPARSAGQRRQGGISPKTSLLGRDALAGIVHAHKGVVGEVLDQPCQLLGRPLLLQELLQLQATQAQLAGSMRVQGSAFRCYVLLPTS